MEDIDLKDWELVISNGTWWVGKATVNGHSKLEPVYYAHYQPVPTEGPTGERGIAHAIQLMPFFGCGIPSLNVPAGAIRIALTACGDRGRWIQRIQAVAEMQRQARTPSPSPNLVLVPQS